MRLPLLYLMMTSIIACEGQTEKSGIQNLRRLLEGRNTIGSTITQTISEDISNKEKNGSKSSAKEDDSKKPLWQQVADGKYGLIQKELFARPVSRPGIVSYNENPEVPDDNEDNLGGLNKSDIWLADNHLLVLRGGVFPETDSRPPEYGRPPAWPPIDDYSAPRRQVKIPEHPRVPPPFPVQLWDGGPFQILGTNSSRTLNDSVVKEYLLSTVEGFDPNNLPPFAKGQYSANAAAGETPFPVPPFAYDPSEDALGSKPPFPLNETFPNLPPGAVVLPPPSKNREEVDEDDLSIYYPPPYSFYYPKQNITKIHVGPLVPGIVLPPPPDFFGRLEEKLSSTKKPILSTTLRPLKIYPTTTPTPSLTIKLPIEPELPRKKFKTTKNPQFVIRNITRTTSSTTAPPPTIITPKRPSVTILKPISPPPKQPVYLYENEVLRRPFGQYGPPKSRNVVTTTKVPLKAYYSSSNSPAANPGRVQIVTPRDKGVSQAQFYFYEEQAAPPKTQYQPIYVGQEQSPGIQYVPRLKQAQYYYLPTTESPIPYNRPKSTDTFKTHVTRLQQQIEAYKSSSPKPVYQYSFQAANYQEQHDKLRNPKYTVQIQPAIEITTPPPRLPPAPIYQPKKQPSALSNFEKQFYEITSGVSRNRIRSTPRPIVQNYYTRPDESYDDLTKNYFTTFGTKLAAATATTPMPPPPPVVAQRPISLQGDILVNFVTPRPAINPHAEIIRPQPAPQSENVQTVQAISIPVQKLVAAGQQGSFVSYELPGDNGAHFYFLTPQLTQRRDQGVTYYFSKPGKTE